MSACVECNGTHSVYNAYLLTCSQCKTTYHHSCHKPPLSQDRLTSILSATFGDIPDVENSLLSWKCSLCTGTLRKRAATVADERPAKRVAAVEVISISSDSESEDVRSSSPIEIVDSPRHEPMDIDEPQAARVPDAKPDIATTWLRDLLYKDLSGDPWERRKNRRPHRRPRKSRVAANVDSYTFVNKY
ncbi:hypothetical protein IW261DRAFT_1447231 [Armillaria novae-zelandiae]|uniref:Zinc finger PHD-type domain-containing protein n=1 Tax=Armillaria novae-zelandiae TaxID=153914 RepID=A0AA39UH85_9AGAR|nr:hypothetical protein IW261DRAFT_1447231 [Armillaria novae-zelandiae]